MKYPSTSSREAWLLEELKKRGIIVFNPLEAANILGVPRNSAHRTLSRMESKGLVRRLERGKYAASSTLRERDVHEVACQIVRPSYLSLWTGLNLYGYTTQVPRVMYLMVTVPRPGLELNSRLLRFVSTRHFFGYRKDGGLIIAEPEKLFLDCLAFPEHSGGIGEITEALEVAGLDGDKMLEYAMMMRNRSLNSRLGHLLESLEKGFDTDPLRELMSASYVPLDPARPKKGERDKRWNIIVNTGGG